MRYYIYIFLVAFLSALQVQAQVVQYPIVNQVRINPPSTTYLTDLVTPNTNRFELTLIQNDFNEAEYDVRLRISIEGGGISLVTSPGFQPAPLTLTPGATLFTGSDLEEYFNPANMLVSGIDPTELLENGSGLPEGLYTICVETFDYIQSETALSLPQCIVKNFVRNYPPVLIFPTCGSTVNTNNQNVLFQWQSQADPFINVVYNLKIVECPEGIDPNDAVNGTDFPLFDEDVTMGTNFNYGPENLPFEVGHRYAYRIQARDEFGETTFENDGQTEVCTFFYGAAPDTEVPLLAPESQLTLDATSQIIFEWGRPLDLPPGMQLKYHLNVVRISNGQSAENAIRFNNPFYEVTTPFVPGNGAEAFPFDFNVLTQKAYAWQVKAYTEAEGELLQVGESEVREFFSAPSVQKIKTGNPLDNQRWIVVSGLTKDNDLPNGEKIISGSGRAPIDSLGNTVEIEFTNLQVSPYDGDWQIVSGVIDSPVDLSLRLNNGGADNPNDWSYNGKADFIATHVLLDKDDMKLRGRVEWRFPHAVNAAGEAMVRSEETVAPYNYYRFYNHTVNLEEAEFSFLDPAGFDIKYESASTFYLTDKTVSLSLTGHLTTPEDVVDTQNKRVQCGFTGVDNPWYFTVENTGGTNVRVIENSTVQLDPEVSTFDLSELESPANAGAEDWKGIYFESFKLRFPKDFDKSNQLAFDQDQNYDFTQNSPDIRGWVDGGGLDLKVEKHFSDSEAPTASFNDFKDDVKDIVLDIENNSVNSNSVFKGYVYIPVLSPTEHFNYTIAVGQTGLQVSFLDDDLVNREFSFNADNADKKVTATIKQAVFRNNNRLDLVVDLEWAYIQVGLFDITGLKIWGNGDFGFGQANGFKGVTNVTGMFENAYEVTIDSLGAGMYNGSYAFNFIGSMVLGDENSGIAGNSNSNPPKFNMVSSELRDADLAGTASTDSGSGNWVQLEEESDIEPDNPNKMSLVFPFKIKTSVADAKGHLIVMYNHPDWGNAFYGVVDASVKKPKPFELDAKVMVGKKDEVSYWFVELGIGSGDIEEKKDKKGKTVKTSKEKPTKQATYNGGSIGAAASASSIADAAANGVPKKKTSIRLGKVEITEVKGRIYYHMSKDMLEGLEDCDLETENSVPMGSGITESTNDVRLPGFPDLSLPQIKLAIDILSLEDLQRILCNMTRKGFKAVLGTLPAPDFSHLSQHDPDTDWVQVQANFPGVTYTHLEVMFPGMEWCQIIASIPGIDWSELFFDLKLNNQFPDMCDLTQFMMNKMFGELEEQKPADHDYFIANNVLTEDQWIAVEAQFPEVTWRRAYELFPNNNWCELMVSLPGIDWGSIWIAVNLPDFDLPDIMGLLADFLTIDWSMFDIDLGLPEMPVIDVDMTGIPGMPEVKMDYEVDGSTLFGAMLMVRLQDTPTMGKMIMATGQMEFTVNTSGGLNEIFFKVEGGGGNPKEYPTKIDDAMVKMIGCFHYGVAAKTFTAKVQAEAKKGVCGQGALDLVISPNYLKLDLGSKEMPIAVTPGCTGIGMLGWLNVEHTPDKTEIGAGVGLSIGAYLQSETVDLLICDVYGYFNMSAAFAVYAEATIQNEQISLNKAGLTFGANVNIGANFSGTFCDYGNVDLVRLYLGGDLEYDFNTKKLFGAVAGEAEVLIFSVDFEYDVNLTI